MNKMPLYTFILILGLFGCSSQKKLVEQAPFVVEGPTCQEFAAGRPEGGSGYILRIPLETLPSSVQFGKVYFRGTVLSPQLETEKGHSELVCKFEREEAGVQKDIIMHADPMEEVGNQPPVMLKENEEDFPFELDGDEAVLEYKEVGKRKSRFYKIIGIKEKMPVQYPSRPQN